MFGILNLNKPIGYTSRDAVNRIQRLIRPVKVGHAGTLDPLAQGVLVLCLGPATRLIEKVQQMPKTYQGTFRLGCHSATDDTEAELVPLPDATRPTHAEILAALGEFRGQIQQRPPAYSAIKIGGRRAYHMARRGQSIDLPPRSVTIHSIAIHNYTYPELVLDIVCGSGTYIRSLGRDLAEAMGTAAVMTGLIRTAIGPYTIDQAFDPKRVKHGELIKWLQSPLTALGNVPRVQLTDSQITDVQHGRFILHDSIELPKSAREGISPNKEQPFHSTKEIAALDSDNHLIALLVPKPGNRWGPSRNFPLPR